MVYLLIRAGVVETAISANGIADLIDIYPPPEYTLIEQVGAESIGWAFDGATFTPPAG